MKKSFLLMAALAITFTTQGAANAQQRADDGKSAAEMARETLELLEAWEAEEAAAKEAAEAKAAKETAEKAAKEAAAAKGVPKERPPARVEGGKVVYGRAGKCVVIDLPLGEPPSKAAKDTAKKAKVKAAKDAGKEAKAKAAKDAGKEAKAKAAKDATKEAKAKAAKEREKFEAWAEHEMHGFRPMRCHYCEDEEAKAWEAAEACRRAEEARARAKIDKAVKKALNNPVYRKFLQQYGTPAIKAALDKALKNRARALVPEPPADGIVDEPDPKKTLEALRRMRERYQALYPPSSRKTPDFQPSEDGVRERARQEMEERLREAELTRPRTAVGANPCVGPAASVPAPQPCQSPITTQPGEGQMQRVDPPTLILPTSPQR